MSVNLPAIPGEFPRILTETLHADLIKRLSAYSRDEIAGLAQRKEQEFNAQLKAKKPGDEFMGLKVIRVDEPKDQATLRAELSGDVPGVPGLKVGAASAEFLVDRWVNLTDPSKPPIHVIGLTSFAIEINLSKKGSYEIRLGYAQDDNNVDNRSQLVLVGVEWKNPEFRLFGLLGQSNLGGILIDVQGESPIPIPLGATGLGLNGVGLLYGKHFAPLIPGTLPVPAEAMKRLASADAKDYADWAQSAKTLTTWIAVPDEIDLFGVSATVVDMPSAGRLVRLQQHGLAYISYGPTISLSGDLRVLDKIEAGRTIGVIDLRWRSFFARAIQKIDVIPWSPDAIVAEGSVEVSASLSDDRRTYIAVGGYEMNGCRMKLLGFMELTGGVRLVPSQGVAASATGRLEAEGTVAGFGGGFSFWIDIRGELGWNPVVLGARLEIGGVVWIEACGKKLSLGATLLTELYLKKPFVFRMKVDFEIKIWFAKIRIPVTLWDHQDVIPETPAPALNDSAATALAIMHPPSGLVGVLDVNRPEIWPDTMFVLDFQRSPGGSPIIVNAVAGAVREAGVDVLHRFDLLEIERKDPLTGNFSKVVDVRASWLLDATSGGTSQSSRLAIPCNDPLAWLQRYDYGQPDIIETVGRFRLQTFGVGPLCLYLPSPAGRANAWFEEVGISRAGPFCLMPVPWAQGYARALLVPSIQVDFSTPAVGGRRTTIEVDLCELRLLAPFDRPPQIRIRMGTAAAPEMVRIAVDGVAEWAIRIERTAAEAGQPLIVESESSNFIAAIGYRRAVQVARNVPDTVVFARGSYRVRTAGATSASFRNNPAPGVGNWRVSREFDVVAPPLRPYVRYATLGDERIFGLDAGGWNPNPAGQGFGHYSDHLGQVRASVGYLDKIYPKLLIYTDDASASIDVAVRDCLDHTPAGAKASQQWKIITGQPVAIEDELSFVVNERAGPHRLTVRRFADDGIGPGDIIDQWTYRVSRYRSASAHLDVGPRLSHAIGPFGVHTLPAAQVSALPAGFDVDTVTEASTDTQWALPRVVSGFVGVESTVAGLSFLQALDWCGIFDAPPDPLGRGPCLRPDAPDLCLLMDRSRAPFGLLLRTAEPCDWRRVEIVAVTCFADPNPRRFAVKVIPSPDGCQSLLILLADNVPVRVPKGDLVLRIRFKLQAQTLPRLTLVNSPEQTVEEIVRTVDQPLGATWWEV